MWKGPEAKGLKDCLMWYEGGQLGGKWAKPDYEYLNCLVRDW